MKAKQGLSLAAWVLLLMSRPRTEWPLANARAHTARPTEPLEPVIAIFMMQEYSELVIKIT